MLLIIIFLNRNFSVSIQHRIVTTLTYIINVVANWDCLLLRRSLQPIGHCRITSEEWSGYQRYREYGESLSFTVKAT